MRRSACVLAALLLVGGIVGATSARAANELAVAAGRDGDPALNAVYAARGFAPLWTGSSAAEKRRETLLALLRAETGGDPATASGAAARGRRDAPVRRYRRSRSTPPEPRSTISRAAPAATPIPADGARGHAVARPAAAGDPAGAGAARARDRPGPGRLAAGRHPARAAADGATRRRWPAPRSTWPRACRRARRLPEPVSLRRRLVQSADLSAQPARPAPRWTTSWIERRAPVPGPPRPDRGRCRGRAHAGRPERAGRARRSRRCA